MSNISKVDEILETVIGTVALMVMLGTAFVLDMYMTIRDEVNKKPMFFGFTIIALIAIMAIATSQSAGDFSASSSVGS